MVTWLYLLFSLLMIGLGLWFAFQSLKKNQYTKTFIYLVGILFTCVILYWGKGWIDHFSASPSTNEENLSENSKEQGNDEEHNGETSYENHGNHEKEDDQKDPSESPSTNQPNDENSTNEDEKNPPSMDDFYDPENETYTVQKGNTLWSISRHFGVTLEELKFWNHLTSDSIRTGSTLKVAGPPIHENSAPNDHIYDGPSILIYEGKTNKKEIALTFDAGSSIEGIKILNVLKKHQVKSTFFLTGKWVEKFPDYTKMILADGHEIANHSYGHEDFTKISHEDRLRSIVKTDEAIQKAIGMKPVPLFRFPYGAYNKDALQSVGEAGYKYSVHWSLDTIDWQQPEASVIVERILSKASNGGIVLMHIGGINTPEAVDQVIPILKKQGYAFVKVGQWLDF